MEPLIVLLLNDFITEYDTEQVGDKRLIITIMDNFMKEDDEEETKFICETSIINCVTCYKELEISDCLIDHCNSYDHNRDLEKETGWEIWFTDYDDEYLCSTCKKIFNRCETCLDYYKDGEVHKCS